MLGFDMYIANKVMLISVHAFGRVCSYLLFRKLGMRRLVSYIDTGMICWSCTSSAEFCHTQLVFVAMFPCLLLEAIFFYENRNRELKKRVLYGIILVLTRGVLFLTAFYVAYFVMLFIVLSIFIRVVKYERIYNLVIWVRKHLMELLFYSLLNFIWICPFLLLYLPVLIKKGGYGDCLIFSPHCYDLFRSSSQNFPEKRLVSSLPMGDGILETMYGPTFFIWCLLFY